MALIRGAHLQTIELAVLGQSKQLCENPPELVRTACRLQSYYARLGDPHDKRIEIACSIQAFCALSSCSSRPRGELQKCAHGASKLECLLMIDCTNPLAFFEEPPFA